MAIIFYMLLCFALLLSTGCEPGVSMSGTAEPSLFIRPDHLKMASSVSPVELTVVLSNSTSRMLVLASDDIDLYGNLALVAHHRLSEVSTNWDALGYNLLLINPKGLSGKPEAIELAPGAVWEDSIHLPFGVRFCGVPDTNTESQIVAMFCGWNPKALRSYRIEDFPAKLRPYVWTNTVTSAPMSVVFENSLVAQTQKLLNMTNSANHAIPSP